jgi:hypothetical protein
VKTLFFSQTFSEHRAPEFKLLAETEDENAAMRVSLQVPQLLGLERGIPEFKPGPRAKPVRILGIAPGSEFESLLRDLVEFSSAKQASDILGFNYNAVGLALNKARGEPVIVKGVELQYLDDIPYRD